MDATHQDALKAANEELSQACFETGRLHYEIELKAEELEDMQTRFHNMGVNFRKLQDKYRKALKESPGKVAPKAAPDVPEMSLEPQLEVQQ
jgi:DNA repair ATPase RecN